MTSAEKLQKMAENEQALHGILKDTADVIRKYNGWPDLKVPAECIPGEVDFLYTAGKESGEIIGHEKGFAEGKQEGWNTGYDNGYSNGYEQGEQEGWEDGFSEGHMAGEEVAHNTFWDAIQEGGKRTTYTYAFAYWGNIEFYPKHQIKPTLCGYLFFCSKIKTIPEGTPIDFSQATSMTYIFSSCSVEAVYVDISTVSSSDLSAMFGWSSNIRYINHIILKDDGSQKLNYMFDNCYALESVAFSGKFGANISFSACTKLDHDSIASIVNALLETASGKTLTLSKTAVNKAFEGGSTGAEWLDLIATKSNWTISLV